MPAKRLRCIQCDHTFQISQLYNCPDCGGILKVEYDYENIHINEVGFKKCVLSRYSSLLPINENMIVTMGEGDTPLTEALHLGKWLGLENLYIKNEGCNPTGSFKDRPISVGISKARDFGVKTVIISSSGNAGASVAAYAAKAGMEAIVLVPEGTPIPKILQTIAYGAQIVMVKGTFSHAFNIASLAAEKLGWANLATTFLNPYTVEGNKTIAYEIIESLNGKVPDFIIIPLGDGPLLVGIWWGFNDFYKLGYINKLPKLIGVQADACAPIAIAFSKQRQEVEPWHGKYKTLASGIADSLEGYASDGNLVLSIIKDSNGYITTVSEKEIIESVYMLARLEGVYAEPSGAVTIKAIQKMVSQGFINPDDIVVSIVTGHGLKDNLPDFQHANTIPTIEAYEDLFKVIKKNKCGILL